MNPTFEPKEAFRPMLIATTYCWPFEVNDPSTFKTYEVLVTFSRAQGEALIAIKAESDSDSASMVRVDTLDLSEVPVDLQSDVEEQMKAILERAGMPMDNYTLLLGGDQ